MASYSLFLALPFAKSPTLAAVVSTFMTIMLAIVGLVFASHRGCTTVTASIFTLLFPPGFYIFVIRSISGWELALSGAKIGVKEASQRDPSDHLRIDALLAVGVVSLV